MHHYAGYLVSKPVEAIKFNEIIIFLLKITHISDVLNLYKWLSLKYYLTGSFQIISISNLIVQDK